MAHDHGGHGIDASTTFFVRRIIVGAVLTVACVTAVGVIGLWPTGARSDVADELGLGEEPWTATAADIATVTCTGTTDLECTRVGIVPDDDALPPGTLELTVGGANPEISTGDELLVYSDGRGGYVFADFQRARPLALLVVLFVAAVVVLGRFRGLGALAGLVGSVAVLTVFLLPAINQGSNPLAASLVAASLVAFIALYLAHGITIRTSVALLGTLASLLVTGVLALVFVAACNITGLADETVLALQASVGGFDVRGLLLAGVIIGSLGVLDDVTVTQVAAVWELRAADPTSSPRQLYRAALRIGRDHISSTVNTLVLAYAGASLPLLLLFTQAGRSITSLATSEIVAIEVIRALVGSIGLVVSVPLTTGLAVLAVAHARSGQRRDDRSDDPPPHVS